MRPFARRPSTLLAEATLSARFATFATLATALLAGCAAPADELTDDPTAEPSAAATDALETAQCPASLDIALEKPVIASSTPTLSPDGSPLSELMIGRVAAGMTAARELSLLRLPLELTSQTHGRCTYEAAPDGARPRRATLRQAGTTPVLDVEYGEFRTHLHPTSLDATGLHVSPSRTPDFYVTVPLSGPFSEGATLTIKIGTTRLIPDPALL